MAVTQFESVDARRCFPCWDEPAFKAKFKLTLEVPSELTALSNMPVANTTVAGPIKTIRYQESPLMSTYLVAIVVGLFEYVEGVTAKGTRVRVYTQVGKSSQGKFALDVGVKSLNLYKDYFGTPFPLPKMDMVAIPDFAAGAMENYGLVTYREVALLFDDKSSSASSKQNVAITVAHELAHQWFGNLVTMEWWTHLWLNEGFATWVSHLAVDSFFPQWNIWTQFLDSTTTALRLDSLEESHPIEVEIHHASEVDQIFDAISYEKGASVIRMLHSYLGADRFQETGVPVKDLMTSWTKQKGYPVINAKLKGNDMELEQGANLKTSSGPSAPAPAGGSAGQFRGQARLPRFAAPRRYELRLRPNLVACTFSGSVAIAVAVSVSTRFLVLNAADLSVDRASIRFQALAPTEVVFFKEDDVVVLGFAKQLPLGEGVLKMDFNGTLNDQMRGFYRSKYQYKGKARNMAVTQFEPVDARRCFPCWDEPAFKAKFKLTLEVPSELVALSNMPVANTIVAGPIKTVRYQESPLMSTYLVAIVVGLFEYIEGVTSQGTRIRVYTQVGKSSQGKFALDVGVKSLDLYKDYFDTPYPLPKLDMVAIPDFAAGAMENYGLVTFRDVALLFDDKSSSASSKQDVAITVAHELAHQWFGNLVTMEWWTHLWLNEGFATWVSHLAVDSFFPQWNIWTQFLDSTTDALKLDSLEESHPIEVEIHHASEVDQIFDAISYDKGASLIRMLQSYLGAYRFQKALASYIKKYAYSNAKTEDLWAVLEKETGEPVKDLMSTWTKQKGYPVINAKLKGINMELDQAQFLLDGSSGPGMWIVPITSVCGAYDSAKKFLFKLKRDKLVIASQCGDRKKGGNFWTKLNINGTGFYRVKYDEELAAALQNALETKKLSLMDKIGIVDDSHALSMARQQTLASLLRLLYCYRGEADFNVLSHINSVTTSIAKISVDATPGLAGDIKQLLIKILLSPAEKLGWDPKTGESHLDLMLRPLLLIALVQLGHGKTINEGVRRFNIFIHDRNTSLLPPDTRKAAYLAVIQNVSNSNRSGYDALRKVYRESAEGEERLRVLGILSSCRDKGIVLESLNLIFTNEVRNQDAYIVLRGIQIEAREIAWNWLKENWERISKTFSASSLVAVFVKAIVPLFSSNGKAAEISKFFATRTTPGFERTLKQSLEIVRINARWVEGIKSEPGLAQTVRELLGKP